MADQQPVKKNFFDKAPLWLRLVLFFFFWIIISVGYVNFREANIIEEISYSEFKEKMAAVEVAKIDMKGQEVTGKYVKEDDEDEGEKQPEQQTDFSTVLPSVEDPELMSLLEENNVVIHAEPEQENWVGAIFISLLPWLLIIGFFVYMNKKMKQQMGGMGGGGPFGFGKSKRPRKCPG